MVVGLLPPSAGYVTHRRRRHLARARRDDARGALRRRIQMIFQDPYASLNPRWRVGAIVAEPIKAFDLIAEQARARRPRRRAAVAGRPRSARRAQVSARILRRPAPAHRHRPRARLQSGVHRLRRADLGARRLGAGAGAQSAARSAGAARPDLSLHQPQSRGRAPRRDPRRRAVSRPAGRGGAGEDALFAEPRHPYTRMLLDSVPDIDMTGRERVPIAGENAEPDRAAAGLPFPPALPVRLRPLPRRGAGVQAGGGGSRRRVPCGRGGTDLTLAPAVSGAGCAPWRSRRPKARSPSG